jgi:hypothetical protein
MKKNKNAVTRIKNLLDEGPLVAFYFTISINFLKEKIDKMSDEEIAEIFTPFLLPDRVRDNVDYIYKALND